MSAMFFEDPWKHHWFEHMKVPGYVEVDDEKTGRVWWAAMHCREVAAGGQVPKRELMAAARAWLQGDWRQAAQIVADGAELPREECVERAAPTTSAPQGELAEGGEIDWSLGEGEAAGEYDADEGEWDPDGGLDW